MSRSYRKQQARQSQRGQALWPQGGLIPVLLSHPHRVDAETSTSADGADGTNADHVADHRPQAPNLAPYHAPDYLFSSTTAALRPLMNLTAAKWPPLPSTISRREAGRDYWGVPSQADRGISSTVSQ